LSAHAFKAASLALSFALNIVVARILPIEQAGTFMTLLVLVPALSMAGRCGTDVFVLRYSRWGDVRGARIATIGMPHAQLMKITLAGSVLIALAGAVGMIPFGPLFSESSGVSPLFVLPLLASVPFNAVSVLNSAVLRAAGKFRLSPFLELGLAQGVAMVAVLPISLVAANLFLALSLASLVGWAVAAAVSVVAVRSATAEFGTHEEPVRVWPLVWITIGGITFYAWTWLPAFAAWLFLGAAEAGIVVAILKYVALLNLVQVIQVNSLLPRVASLQSAARLTEITRLVRRQLMHAAPLNACIAIGLALLAQPLMQVYGPTYAENSRLLALSAIAFGLMWSVFGLVVPVTAVLGEAKLTTIWTLTAGTLGAGALWFIGESLGTLMAGYLVLTTLMMATIALAVRRKVGASVALGLR